MKKLITLSAAALVALASSYASAETYNKVVYSTSTEITLGEWNCQYTIAKEYAEANNIPMILFWGNRGCSHCQSVEYSMGNTATASGQMFTEWQKTTGYVMVFVVNNAVGTNNNGVNDAMKAKNALGTGSYPLIGFYWKKPGSSSYSRLERLQGTVSAQKIIDTATKAFAGYEPQFNVMGKFDGSDTAYDRLEAEKAGTVPVRLTREKGGKAATGTLVVKNGSATVETKPVTWAAASGTKQEQYVDITVPTGLTAGKTLTLELKNGDGKVEQTALVHYVAPANAVANPLWLGEKTSTQLKFGEWTMDLDVAKQKVAATGGAAYTLVCVQGSQWCPDCGNVEKNFLDVKKSGANAFAKWAESKNVALVAIDIPNFKSASVDAESPCLLKRDAFETHPEGGDYALHSGLAYLTRKGVSATDAAACLSRNHDLVTKNTDNGGFHRPEDTNANRTGVPIFVLLRKDGTVAARLTRMAAVSPTSPADFDNILKRFDEMLWIADNNATEIENNYPSAGSVPLDAKGAKSETATLSHVDQVDTFLLEGVGGNSLQKVTVSGKTAAEVTVEYCTLEGGKVKVLASTSGKLSDGPALEHTFTAAGTYYVRISAKDITSEAFKLESPTASHFTEYTVSGSVVLVPGEDKAEATGGTFTIRLVKDTIYRMTGLTGCAKLTQVASGFYQATAGGDATVTTSGKLEYQIWKPCTVGFADFEAAVIKSYCDQTGERWKVAVQRKGGKSGAPKVKVSVNEELTTLDREAFTLYTTELNWSDGDLADKNVELYFDDDPKYTYNTTIVLNLELVNAADLPGCGIAKDAGRYVLLVIERDAKAPGRAMFSRTEPEFAKAKTVYVKEGETGTVYVARIEDALDQQHVTIKSSLADARFDTDDWRDFGYTTREQAETAKKNLGSLKGPVDFYWADLELSEKPLYVTGVKAGKTAKLTMTAFNRKGLPAKDQFKVVSASNTVSIVGVAKDAPEFTESESSATVYRYVNTSKSFPLKPGTFLMSNKKTFTKLSGSIPAGLKTSVSEAGDALVISGVPTGKAGTYEAICQVSETRSNKKVAGLTIRLAYTVVDPVDAKQSGGALNPAAAVSRTIPDIPVFGLNDQRNLAENRLAGTLTLTIPPTGRLSAKYLSAAGTVSLSAKSWAAFGTDGDLGENCLAGQLAGTGKNSGYELDVTAAPNGMLKIELHDPSFASADLVAYADGKVWTKGSTSRTKPVAPNTAEAWKGYYTAALVPQNLVEERTDVAVAPRGTGYLTLKMDTASAWNAGKVTWAGMLPNGTTMSGSAVLTRGVEGLIGSDGFAYLPLFKQSKTDVFGSLVQIEKDAAAGERLRSVKSVSEMAVPYWEHVEKTAEARASYFMDFDVRGAIYDKKAPLDDCCKVELDTLNAGLTIKIADLADYVYNGTPADIAQLPVTITSDKMTVPTAKDLNPQAIKLTLNRSTGIVNGTFKIPYVDASGNDKTLSATYRGIVLSGWGEGCGCGDPDPQNLPFVNAAYYFTDKVPYEVTARSGQKQVKTLSVKRGGRVLVEKSSAK